MPRLQDTALLCARQAASAPSRTRLHASWLVCMHASKGPLASMRSPGRESYLRLAFARIAAHLADVVQIAEKAGVSPATLALAWCRVQPGVASTIIGATTVTQLKENLAAFEQELSDETLEEIDTVHKNRKDPSTIE